MNKIKFVYKKQQESDEKAILIGKHQTALNTTTQNWCQKHQKRREGERKMKFDASIKKLFN